MCDKGGGNRSQAPKIVGVVGLSDSADTSQVSNFILQGADEIEIPHSVSGTFDNVFSIKLLIVGDAVLHQVNLLPNCSAGCYNSHKQSLCVVDCGIDFNYSLDTAKVRVFDEKN